MHKKSLNIRVEDAEKDTPTFALTVRKIEPTIYRLADGIEPESENLSNRPIPQFERDNLQVMLGIRALPNTLNPTVRDAFYQVNQARQYEEDYEAIDALCGHLREAIRNPIIEKNKAALSLAILVLDMVEACRVGDGDDVARELIVKPAISERNTISAAAKNANSKAWVLAEWDARKDKTASKKEFAKRYALLLRSHSDSDIRCKISAERIERYWLPKTSKNSVKTTKRSAKTSKKSAI